MECLKLKNGIGRLRIQAGFPARLCLLLLLIITIAALFTYEARAEDDSVSAPSRVFFLANEKAGAEYDDIYAIMSDLEIKGTVYGKVYAVFSNVTVSGVSDVAGGFRTLSSTVFFPSGVADGGASEVSSVLGSLFSSSGFRDGVYYISDGLPPYIISASLALMSAVLCLVAYGTRRGFVEQGGVLLTAEPGRVIRNGIVLYFLAIALILVLTLTIILLPFALLFVIVLCILIILGQTSLAMLIGLIISRRVNRRFAPAICLLIGLGIMTVMSVIPFLGTFISIIPIPILSAGIALTCVINGLFKKKFYYAPFKTNAAVQCAGFDREAMKSIILNKNKD